MMMKNPNSALKNLAQKTTRNLAQNSALNSNENLLNSNTNSQNQISPNVILKARNLSKNYGTQSALKNVSFELKKGEIFGLIGADGAGKSTLVRILSTLLLASSGECEILGFDIKKDYKKIRPKLGYMPATFSLYADLSVEENLQFFADIFAVNLEQNYPLIAPIYKALEPFKKRKAGALSGGMKQKLLIAIALAKQSELLLFDEPTANLDPKARAQFLNLLNKKVQDKTIVFISHRVDEVRTLTDRVIEMDLGKIIGVQR